MRTGYPTLRARPGQGFTLLEVLVALVLFSLAGLLLVQIFGPTVQVATRSAHRIELHQSAWLAMDRITDDLAAATPGGWSHLSNSQQTVLSVHRLFQMTPQGTRSWEDTLRVYSWEKTEGVIYSVDWPPGPPNLGVTVPLDTSLSLSTAQLQLFVGADSPRRKILADQVSSFEVSQVNPPGSQPLKVRIVLESDEPGVQAPQRFELEREAMTWNS